MYVNTSFEKMMPSLGNIKVNLKVKQNPVYVVPFSILSIYLS